MSGRGPDLLPWPVRALPGWIGSATRSSVGNARDAAAALTAVVRERRALVEALAPDQESGEAGTLSRLDPAHCWELLGTRSVGRLAYVARAGTPDVVPVNYALHDGAVLVRSGPGPKAQAGERGDVVAFEVDDLDEEAATGWSVVVVGRLERLAPGPAQRLARAHGPQPWAGGPRSVLLRLTPSRIDGRRLW